MILVRGGEMTIAPSDRMTIVPGSGAVGSSETGVGTAISRPCAEDHGHGDRFLEGGHRHYGHK